MIPLFSQTKCYHFFFLKVSATTNLHCCIYFENLHFTKKMSKQENNYCVFIQNMLQYKEENFLCFFLFPEKAERKDKYVSIGKGYAQ